MTTPRAWAISARIGDRKNMLSGRAALIVESEYIIGMDVQALLQGLGAEPVYIVRTSAEAAEVLQRDISVSLAVIEAETHKPELIDLVLRLTGLGITVICTTADRQLAHDRPELTGHTLLVKPVPEDDLLAAITAVFGSER
ncbi:MAG: hypothetical protein KIT02_08060 [Devosia sp.]|uniref:hypothetical protein n=1 Tax=Devosia sp. TaxID=1871048 RepID=UPI0024CCC679|nr:hypothetical protein [Devosia sp.]UYO01140.1 MAG: hypothetical protein KIT02_08060 [Devosia sp.]